MQSQVGSTLAASVLIFFLTLQLAGADLPVHCLLQDVAGEWDFAVGPAQNPVFSDMVAGIPQCGHHIPNTVPSMLSAKASDEVPEATAQHFRLRLTEDILDTPMRHMEVIGLTNSSNAAAGHVAGGYWTMVFDEGFEVRAHDGRSFFAHFYFEALPDASGSPSHGDRWEDIGKYHGRVQGDGLMKPEGDMYACHCNRVSVGWWHQRDGSGKLQSGCFWARKADEKGTVNMVRMRNTNAKDGHLTQGSSNSLRGARNLHAAPVRLHTVVGGSDDVMEIRDIPADSQWAPRKELIVPEAGSMDQQSGAHALQASAVAKTDGQPNVRGVNLLGTESLHLSKNTSMTQSLNLPKFWDWRDVVEDMAPPGVDDLSEQFNQGNCGSCYAFSGALVLQMRYRIQLFKKHGILYPLELSWKSATRCSPYTEGCQGGFAYLIFKYAAEVGLPLAECDRSRAPDSLDESCDWSCYRNNSMIFYAKNYGQTGGFAHGSSEESIMQEIHANGPVIVSFAASAIPEFIYNNGKSLRKDTDVMTVIKNDKVPQEPSSSNDDILPWSYTTHSILAVGWGEETASNGEVLKYWVVRNSWGKDWGNQGYAKIRRGNNDAAIETSAPWVEPDMDRLPPGFLEMARQYHEEHLRARAKTNAKAAEKATETKPSENKGGRPAYCKLRPNSPDCK